MRPLNTVTDQTDPLSTEALSRMTLRNLLIFRDEVDKAYVNACVNVERCKAKATVAGDEVDAIEALRQRINRLIHDQLEIL